MAKRRDLLALAALLPATLSSAGKKLENVTLPASKAAIQNHPFGDQAVYFSGATDQLKFMEAGNLRLKAGMEPHPPHSQTRPCSAAHTPAPATQHASS